MSIQVTLRVCFLAHGKGHQQLQSSCPCAQFRMPQVCSIWIRDPDTADWWHSQEHTNMSCWIRFPRHIHNMHAGKHEVTHCKPFGSRAGYVGKPITVGTTSAVHMHRTQASIILLKDLISQRSAETSWAVLFRNAGTAGFETQSSYPIRNQLAVCADFMRQFRSSCRPERR
jgi:hypothetical protein